MILLISIVVVFPSEKLTQHQNKVQTSVLKSELKKGMLFILNTLHFIVTYHKKQDLQYHQGMHLGQVGFVLVHFVNTPNNLHQKKKKKKKKKEEVNKLNN